MSQSASPAVADTNASFVIFCYEKILRRTPAAEEVQAYQQALDSSSLTREQMLMIFLQCSEYESLRQEDHACRQNVEYVPPGHYYSAVPSLEDRQRALERLRQPRALPGLNMRGEAQFQLLQQLKPWFDECPFTDEESSRHRYHFLNRSYSFGDGLTLYAMLREFRPRRVIEIGSGYTSALMLDTNELAFDGQLQLTFIEPYTELLRSLLRPTDQHQTIIEKKAQDVDLAVFDQLQSGDILFIDSTHVQKLGSDVDVIYTDIIPRVPVGTLIHIHDIFWPFEYPQDWIEEGRAWSEIYVLRAFLQFNDSFEIVYFSSYLVHHHRQWFEQHAPQFLRNSGGNIWLRRIR